MRSHAFPDTGIRESCTQRVSRQYFCSRTAIVRGVIEMSIRIVIADDLALVRTGLKHLFELQPDIEIVGQAGSNEELLNAVAAAAPSVVVTDVVMKDRQVAEIIPQIRAQNPAIKFIALAATLDRRFVIGMLQAGASAFLPKDCEFSELLHAVRTVIHGTAYLSPAVSDVIVQYHYEKRDGNGSNGSSLSPREKQVLQLLADDRSTKEIAETCIISKKTVETHRAHLMQKLNAGSVADLVKYAVREGLTTLQQ